MGMWMRRGSASAPWTRTLTRTCPPHPTLWQFLIATRDPMALTYNDRAVLENMHTSEFFRMLQQACVTVW